MKTRRRMVGCGISAWGLLLALGFVLFLGCSKDKGTNSTSDGNDEISGEWQALGSGLNDEVNALEVYQSNLIAAGGFTEAGGSPANFIASWDGVTWQPLGSGLNAPVEALAEWNGSLVAGGEFSQAGGQAASRVARWDGTAWHPLGAGLQGQVISLTVWNGDLIAGIWTAGVSADALFRWNGSTWASLSFPADIGATALTVWNGKLIAGGVTYVEDHYYEATLIASYDGASWTTLGSWVEIPGEETSYASVNHMTVADGDLLVAGSFPLAGGKRAAVIQWNGSSWTALGSNMAIDDYAYAVIGYNSTIVAGGAFRCSGQGEGETCAGYWDGGAWVAMTEVWDDPQAFIVWNDNLIMGGQFEIASGHAVNYIARWVETPSDGCDQASFFDDFDTGLNLTVWTQSTWTFPQSAACFDPSMVSVADGTLRLRVSKSEVLLSCEGGQRYYYAGEVQSAELYEHGIYTARLKAAGCSGLISAFFVYWQEGNDDATNHEIDFEISGAQPNMAQLSTYHLRDCQDFIVLNLGFDSSQDFNDYSFVWEETKVTFYVNGVLKWQSPDNCPCASGCIPDTTAHICLSCWPASSWDFAGPLDHSCIQDPNWAPMEVDWVAYACPGATGR